MLLQATVSTGTHIHAALGLAHWLEMPESDFESQVKEIESKPLFQRLLGAGAVSISPYDHAGFTAKFFGGWGLRTSSEGLPELLDGDGDLSTLISHIGQKQFQEAFLGDSELSDEERGRICGLSLADARRLREFVNRLYVQSEFETFSDKQTPVKVFSAVAGIQIENGEPSLSFFNREIWKGRYRINRDKCAELKARLPEKDSSRLDKLVHRLEFFDRRKSSLYRILEALIEEQSDFLISGYPDRRRPITQRALAARLAIEPSVLNRLISNKSIQLPWGLEAPIKELLPSPKSLLRTQLYDLAEKRPELSDRKLAEELRILSGTALSRRSIAQYRKELNVVSMSLRLTAAR